MNITAMFIAGELISMKLEWHFRLCANITIVDDDRDDVDSDIFAPGSISQSCLSQESSG